VDALLCKDHVSLPLEGKTRIGKGKQSMR